jgi:hypothetical protein
MARDQLLALVAEADRMLAAGAATAAFNERLHKQGQDVRELAHKVPALTPLADAVDRLLQAPAEQAGPAFLDLVGKTRQLRASLAGTGFAGAFEDLPASGPWQTPANVHDLFALVESLQKHDAKREEACAALDLAKGDLRVLRPLLSSVMDSSTVIADHAAEEALPALGPAIIPDLVAAIDVRGGPTDARRLLALCRIDHALGLEWCWRVLERGSFALRIRVLAFLPRVAPDDLLEKAALKLCDDSNQEVRCGAFAALGVGRSGEALERLLEAVHQGGKACEHALKALTTLGHPDTTPRLILKARQQMDGPWIERRIPLLKQLLEALSARQDEKREETARFLLRLAEHKETELRHAAILGLGRVGAVLPEVVPALRSALVAESKRGTLTALQALRCLPPVHRVGVVADVLKLVRSPKISTALRREGILFLSAHNDQDRDVLRIVRAGLRDRDKAVLAASLEALAVIGPTGLEAIDDLHDACTCGLRLPKPLLRAWASIDPEGVRAIPELLRLLQSKNATDRMHALEALEFYGRKAFAAEAAVATLRDNHASAEEYTIATTAINAIWGK